MVLSKCKSLFLGTSSTCMSNYTHSEPEFRLVFMGIGGACCGIGMFLFGYTMGQGSASALCAFFQGVMMVGVLIGIFSTLSYGLDAFRTQSNEIFVMNMLFKVSRMIPDLVFCTIYQQLVADTF